MNTLEAQLWRYIDGVCDAEETATISKALKEDPLTQHLYQQLMVLHGGLNALETDMPSMGFSRSVMDKVALEIPPVALKTHADKRIVYVIGGFFLIALLSIFIYALITSPSNLPASLPAFHVNFRIDQIFDSLLLKIFLIADVVIALTYLDSVLRAKMRAQKKGSTI